MIILTLIVLALLFTKHYVFDFHWQPTQMLVGKGIYGNRWGILHSFLHATLTLAILCFLAPATVSLGIILLVVLVEFIIHYNVDYVKAHYGPKDASKPIFWKWLGLDQYAHYVTYLLIVAVIFI